MASELTKYFDFSSRESELYKLWLAHSTFKPESAADPAAPVFSLAMPPPNANGELHLGHVFGEVTMDVLGRFHRALGERVLLIPGKDHAGIQTQVVFERKLRAEGIDPQALGREEFYKRCYEFCIDRAAYMRSQEQLIGTSADWDRELFTLDPRLIEIVYATFEQMWKDGLVYRGARIVNWSVYSQTAISDVEVEYREEKGSLWYIRYPLVGTHAVPAPKRFTLSPTSLAKSSTNEGRYFFSAEGQLPEPGCLLEIADGSPALVVLDATLIPLTAISDAEFLQKHSLSFTEAERQKLEALCPAQAHLSFLRCLPQLDLASGVVVATTRPETMLGDSAVAYHPQDPRYAHLKGTELTLPIQGRQIPLLADARADMFYGTGVVKVTPAHDFVDYEIGLDHKLEIRQVIGKDGKMTALAGAEYAGLSAKEARAKVLSALEASGQLLRTAEIKHKLPVSERGKDVIEPLVAEQWWVGVDRPVARFSGFSLKQRVLQLLELQTSTAGSHALSVFPEKLRLQLVQWFHNLKDWNISRQISWGPRIPVWYEDGTQRIHVGTQPPAEGSWRPETDTFDTWFSSGQWAFSTVTALGFAQLDTHAPSAFFPTHSMVMGRDILFFWACRMLLLTAYRQNDIPWKNIYFTGLIRDESGQKMSKSKGNGIEPLEMIKSFGADALRLGMIMGTSAGSDANVGPKKIEGYSKAINKLWNAAKLIDLKIEELGLDAAPPCQQLRLESSNWIVGQLQQLQASLSHKLAQYEISQAIEELYQFFWFEYCDWYLEMLKPLVPLTLSDPQLKAELRWVLGESFRSLLVMLHPFIPFVTEEIFQRCAWIRRSRPVLALEPWQDVQTIECKTHNIAFLKSLVLAVRSVKAATGKANNFTDASLTQPLDPELKMLAAALSKVQWVESAAIAPEHCLKKPFQGGIVLCRVDSKPDYRQRLERELTKNEQLLQAQERKLSGEFASRANPELVRSEKQKLEEYKRMLSEMREELALL